MEPDGMLTGIFLHPLLVDAFKKFPSDEWVRAAEEAGLGMSTVRAPGEALSDKSFLADGCVTEIDDPEEGLIRHAGPLLEFSSTPGAIVGPAPRSGEHTDEILRTIEGTRKAASATHPSPAEPALPHALAGVRVLDLGLGVAGPFTGRMLADLGADVIKVNALHDTYWNGTHMGLGTNRGKRSIALNLKDPAGRAVLDRLIEKSDVFTLNWRPGAAARLGLDYETLHEQHPRLVYCNTRGYEKGPRSDLPGTDQNAAAMTGTEWEDGACGAGNPPLWSRSNMGDTGNALLAAIAIAAALYHRDKTGEGQAVSTSIVNAGLLHTSYAWIHTDGTEPDWGHVDEGQYGLSPYYRLYPCSLNEWVFLAAVTSEQQGKLLEILPGSPADDSPESLTAWLTAYFGEAIATEAFHALDDAGIPIEVVDEYFCRNLFDDPEAKRLNLVSETWSKSVGLFEDPGLLVNIEPAGGVIQRGPCACGEHTEDLLGWLGYTDGEIGQLVANRSVVDAQTVTS
jgi:crotonobetainyl-CoA:carnitine CoA-transferase CaiB-like acyl-CoA transferase